MFKKWGFGNKVVSPMDGTEKYDTIEASIGRDPVNPHTFNRTYADLLDNDIEVKTLISSLIKNKNGFSGVVKNVDDDFILNNDCAVSTTLNINSQNITIDILVAPRGLYIKNGQYYYFTDNLRLAERQLSEALKIDSITKDEKVEIHSDIAKTISKVFVVGLELENYDIFNDGSSYYQYIGDGTVVAEGQTPRDIIGATEISDENKIVYTCYIDKYILQLGEYIKCQEKYRAWNPIGLLLEIAGYSNGQNSNSKYTNMILLYFSDENYNFHPEYFKLREMFQIPTNDDVVYYFGIQDGNLTISNNSLNINLYSYKATKSQDTISFTTTDLRTFIPLSESLQNKVFLNVKDSTTDSQDLTDIIDPIYGNEIDYSKINNDPSMFVVLNQKENTNNNAVIAFTGNTTIGQIDSQAIEGTDKSNVWMSNKDIYININDNSSGSVSLPPKYVSIAQAVATSSGITTIETYSSLIEQYGSALTQDYSTVKDVYLVLESNTLYSKKRGETYTEGGQERVKIYWIPVEDPYVQPYNRNIVINYASTSPSEDLTTITFNNLCNMFNASGNKLNLRRDGSNFYIFADGIFKPFTAGINGSGEAIITFNDPITTSTQKLTCCALKGGEQYEAAYTILQAGTQEGTNEPNYSGSLSMFTIKQSLLALPNKINVFVNGELKNEASYMVTGTITNNGGSISLSDKGSMVTNKTYYMYDYTIKQLFKASLISNSGTTVNVTSQNGSNTSNISTNDNYAIFDKNIYDYFVDSADNSIIFFDSLSAGDIIRVEDRVSVVSNFETSAVGSVFPTDPIFGMEFYLSRTLYETTDHTDYNLDGDANDTLQPGWYKYNGSTWVQLS